MELRLGRFAELVEVGAGLGDEGLEILARGIDLLFGGLVGSYALLEGGRISGLLGELTSYGSTELRGIDKFDSPLESNGLAVSSWRAVPRLSYLAVPSLTKLDEPVP